MYFDTSTARSAEDPIFGKRMEQIRLRHGLIYLRGETDVLARKTLGIVGSRDCSVAGLSFARMIGAEAARLGITVVSGGARGIDSAAHQGVLACRGKAVLVLATPLDQPSPLTTEKLFGDVLRCNGLVASEYADGESVHRSHFLERNRIVAALSDVLLVIDARDRSGSLATARHARRLGRPLWVATGAPWDQHAEGSNMLIARAYDARPVTSLAHFRKLTAEHFKLRGRARRKEPHLDALRTPRSIEEWRLELGLDIAKACRLMFELTASGQAKRLPDGRYISAG